jgi:outer membrane protein OmpA-like peptidoglycan-associated protein
MQLNKLLARANTLLIASFLTTGTFLLASTPSSAAGLINQVAPTVGTTTVDSSSVFSDLLNVSGNTGAVTYTTTSSADGLLVNATTGAVTTTGLLPVGTYSVSGTDTDPSADSGTWSYTLSVGASTITPASPTSGTTTVGGSGTFVSQLDVTGNNGAVTYTMTGSGNGLIVNSSGAITTSGQLSAGAHTASGTDADVNGDTGSWSYSLSVTGTITQNSPMGATTTVEDSSTFVDQLNVTGNTGAVTYTTTGSGNGLIVNSTTGAVTTTGPLSVGTHTASGTDADVNGDTGNWSYSLAVTDVTSTPPVVQAIVQTSVTTGSTTTLGSATFEPPAITVSGNTGAVTFSTTTPSSGLKVTSEGIISVAASLPAGIYSVSGTDKDADGDVGTWTYSLTVTNPYETVTFAANGGAGTMGVEKQDRPASLTIDTFTRRSYTFVDWNTSASGAGTAYANGAAYPFTASVTLYAQWKKGKVAFHEVTFNANGGDGSMAVERENTPTGLLAVGFTRKGYTFSNWNTRASGDGSAFANDVTYSFRSSLLLYAQWKKKPRTPAKPEFTVAFISNGGKGAMADERGRAPAPLSRMRFTRSGYTFLYWSTTPGGSGAHYANGAEFSFGANITLYARWRQIKVIVPTAVAASASVNPFAHDSSSLTSALESKIKAVAATAKANHDTKIALVGYGDELSKADQLNESIWAANFVLSRNRAKAVAAYLRIQLTALGVHSFTISAEGNGSSISVTTSSTAPPRYAIVTATLT